LSEAAKRLCLQPALYTANIHPRTLSSLIFLTSGIATKFYPDGEPVKEIRRYFTTHFERVCLALFAAR